MREPREPDKILEIIQLRDVQNHSWREIGELMGMTHQGPYLLYKRWADWAKEQNNEPTKTKRTG